MKRRFRECTPGLQQQIFPPAHFFESSLIDSCGSTECLNSSLTGFIVFTFDHKINILELIVDLLEDSFIFIIQNFFIFFHLHINMFYPLQFLVQNPKIIFIITSYVSDRVFTRNYPVVFVYCASVDTVNAQKFELILTVKCNKVVVDEALLRELIFIRHSIKIQTGAKIFLATLQRLDILCVIFLQEDRRLSWRSLLAHGSIRIRSIRQWPTFFATGHYQLFYDQILFSTQITNFKRLQVCIPLFSLVNLSSTDVEYNLQEIIILLKIKTKTMELKIDDLLAFCSYFILTKTNVKLPHTQQPHILQKIDEPKSKITKNIRRKFQGADSKKQPEKTIKPKIQYSSKTPRKQVSPIHRQDLKDLRQDAIKKYDISHFVSHLTANSTDNAFASKIKEQDLWNHYPKKNENNLQNYQTFGRSRTKTMEYQTFQEKMQKDKNLYSNRYQRPQPTSSQFLYRTENKPLETFLNSEPWWNSQTPKKTMSTFIDHTPKQSYYAAPTFENIQIFQPIQSQTTYSPKNCQYTPKSRIANSPDSQMSKSRTKHQRKKSQRPFYDASKLTIKKEEEEYSWSKKQQNIIMNNKDKQVTQFTKDNRGVDPKNLTQSYLSVDESQTYTQPRQNFVQVAHDSKRETSTTAPPPTIHREFRIDPAAHRETDLDDELGQTLAELSNRKAPVAFQLRINS